MLRRSDQLHLTCFRWTGKHAQSAPYACLSVNAGAFLTVLRVIPHLSRTDRTPYINALPALGTLLRVNFSHETALGYRIYIEIRFRIGAYQELATAAVMAITDRLGHAGVIGKQVDKPQTVGPLLNLQVFIMAYLSAKATVEGNLSGTASDEAYPEGNLILALPVMVESLAGAVNRNSW
jgi:hypothetical protein